MTDVGSAFILVGIGVALGSLGLILRGTGVGGLFERQARLARYTLRCGAVIAALGAVLVLVGLIVD